MRTNKKVIEEPIGGSSQIYVLPDHVSNPVLAPFKQPARGPGGARCIGGMSSSQALAWNRRTCRPDSDGQSKWVQVAPWSQEGDPQAANTVSGRVPMRGTGTDRLVVAMKAL